MATRADNDIKADVISELEDLEYLDTGISLLDAFVVEQVRVSAGRCDILLAFDDVLTADAREGVLGRVREGLADIEGLILLVTEQTTRSELVKSEPNLLHPRPGSAVEEAELLAQLPFGVVPVEEGLPASGGLGGSLSLSALLSQAAEGVPPEELETPGFAIPTAPGPAGIKVYSGGGCGAGTLAEEPAPAPVRPVPAPPVTVRRESPPSVPPPEPSPISALASPPPPYPEPIPYGMVTLSLERYSALILAEQASRMLPKLEDVMRLERENAELRARLAMLERMIG